jgi:acyl carrier protein
MDRADTVSEFIVANFLPDMTVDQLGAGYDLLANGVIDSLGLLRLISWLEERFQTTIDDAEVAPENFRTVAAICRFLDFL